MAQRIWIGDIGDWFTTGNWQTTPPDPNSYPLPGDTVSITTGTATISPDDVTQFGTLNSEQVALGATSSADPATIEAYGAAFGSAFALTTSATYARLLIHGTVSYDGMITASDGGALTIAVPDVGFAPSFVLGADGVIAALGGATVSVGAGGAAAAGGFVNDGAVVVDAGSTFEVGGGATLTNDGTITAFGGTASIASGGAVTGTGTFQVQLGGTVAFGEDTRQTFNVADTQTIAFLDDNATLGIGDPGDFHGQITGFQAGDRIDLYNPNKADYVSYDTTSGTLTIKLGGADGSVIGSLHLSGSIDPDAFSVHFTGHGDTVITSSDATRLWNGGTGDWFSAANWNTPAPDPSGFPLGGDTVVLGAGTAQIDTADWAAHGVLDWEQITLGSETQGTPAVLATDGGMFGANVTLETGGANRYAALVGYGTTVFDGTIIAQAQGGRLTIGQESDGSTADFILGAGGTILATAESSLYLAGGTLTNQGTIVVNGDTTIDQNATLAGSGSLLVQAGGVLIVDGAVTAAEAVTFGDSTGTLRIANLTAFAGSVGGFVHGDAIDLTGISADRLAYDSSSHELQLYQDGTQVGSLRIDDPYGNGTSDFALRPDGGHGTEITAASDGPLQVLFPTMPLPVVATAGETVPLSQILTASFGSVPSGYASYGVYYLGAAWLEQNNLKYWTPPGSDAVDAWYLDGNEEAPGKQSIQGMWYTPASDIDSIALKAGNNIAPTAFLSIPVAMGPNGPTEYVRYDVPVVDPAVMSPTAADGTPDPSDIVASALRFALHYTDVQNNDDCGYIADDVAAAAGATMPWQDGSTDPDQNVSGGFWRVVYRGSDTANPVQDWFTLTQPGDVVRMGKIGAFGHHTTTVVGTVNPDGSLPVYDNADIRDNVNYIGLHNATYWTGTDPASITIYRLDPYHQYLITGTSQGEFIQGSVFDNLIQPGGGRDVITAGARDNEIQDTTANLNGITVTDWHLGDTLDFTDLSPGGALAAYDSGSGMLTVTSSGGQVARVTLSGLQGEPFFIAADGNGGTLVTSAPFDLGQYAGAAASLVAAQLAPLAHTGKATTITTAADFAGLKAADAGQYNIAQITAPVAGSSELLPVGYDAVFLQGSAPVTLSDPGVGGKVLVANAGDDVLVGNGAHDMLVANGGNDLLFGNGDGSILVGGSGADTLVAGAGSATLIGGSGHMTAFGGAASPTFINGTGDSMVVLGSGAGTLFGGAGSMTAWCGAGGGLAYGGAAGGNVLVSGDGAATLAGGGANDLLVAGGDGDAVLVASVGNTTLTGSAGSGNNSYFGGAGNDLIVAGAGHDSVVAGSGSSTIFGGAGQSDIFSGSGADVIVAGSGGGYIGDGSGDSTTSIDTGAGAELFGFANGQAGGNDLIAGFRIGTDHLRLVGYGPDAVQTALGRAIVAGGSTTLVLSDSTQITLVGVAHLQASSFV